MANFQIFRNTGKGCRFFQIAGKTQLPKRLIVGKNRAAGKVLAGKSVIFAVLYTYTCTNDLVIALAHLTIQAEDKTIRAGKDLPEFTYTPSADCTRGQIVTFLYRDMAK